MDVGGSYGALLAAVLQARPELSGAVYDLPDLAAAAGTYLAQAQVGDRATFIGGDFFQSVPEGADAYMLKMIIHDWDDEKARSILGQCRKAAGPNGVVLVMEKIAPETVGGDAGDLATIRGDILMLTAAGGMERTESEYHTLLGEAGLAIRRIFPTSSGFSVIEAVAA